MTSVEAEWHAVCRRCGELGYGALSDLEKTWFNLRVLIDSVNNGGLISYFYNSGADTLDDCLEALTQCGADDVRCAVETLCARFPGGVPRDMHGRNEVINSWPQDDPALDAALEKTDRELIPRMELLERQLSAILADSGLT